MNLLIPLKRLKNYYHWTRTKEYKSLHHRITPKNDLSSLIFFTTWKCGSSVAGRLIEELATRQAYECIDYQSKLAEFSYLSDNPVSQMKQAHFFNKAFQSQGFFYGPIRLYIPIPSLEDYKVILMLREPKDVFTSMYFSFAYSHRMINEHTLKTRQEYLSSDVNQMAVKKSKSFLQDIYKPYMKMLQKHPHILFVKYEEMVLDCDSWLKRILEYLGIPYNQKEIEHYKTKYNLNAESGGINSHKRSVLPGNYQEHLSDETIQYLDELFQETNTYFGFA